MVSYRPAASKVLLMIMACVTLPATANSDCSTVAGTHSGTFSAKGTRVEKTVPQSVSGTWTIKIDSKMTNSGWDKVCPIVGSVNTDLFGTVMVAGEYAINPKDKATFDASNIFFQEAAQTKFINFAFVGKENQFVNISNRDYAYRGVFSVDR